MVLTGGILGFTKESGATHRPRKASVLISQGISNQSVHILPLKSSTSTNVFGFNPLGFGLKALPWVSYIFQGLLTALSHSTSPFTVTVGGGAAVRHRIVCSCQTP